LVEREVALVKSELIEGDKPQLSWLEETLKASDAIWKIVGCHHPLYSTALQHPADPYMIALLEPLFMKYGVSVVLHGHNHLYERLVPVHGIQYFTSGAGGALRESDLDHHANGRLAGFDQDSSFLFLEFEENTLHFTAYDPMLNVIDEGSISTENRNAPPLSKSPNWKWNEEMAATFLSGHEVSP